MSIFALILLFNAYSIQFDLPANLLYSLCYIESRHDINAINKDDGDGDSIGICQVKHSTAVWLGFTGTETDLFNPTINIYFAAKYLRYQLDRYGNIPRAVTAYNRGNAKNLTRSKYSDKVINKWRRFNARFKKTNNAVN